MTTKTDEQEREAFEAWLRSKWTGGYGCAKYDDGSYVDPTAQLLWESRQAGRAALQSQDREDAERYRTLVASGKFVPATLSPSSLWGLRTSGTRATKAELDEAIDHARRIEGEGE